MKKVIQYIESKCYIKPNIGIVLGSGLNQFCNTLKSTVKIPYYKIPNFRKTSVKGHKGEFIIGKSHDQNIICANGRFHFYEGFQYNQVAIIIDIFKSLGCKLIIMTNSSGAVIKEWNIGDLMLIKGHIDYSFRGSSNNPKIIQDNRYDPFILNQVTNIAKKIDINLREGNYTWTTGPTYETPSEIQDIKILGGHAVGMSGLPEIERIHDLKMKMIGLCCLTNYASGISSTKLTHKEVVCQAQNYQNNFTTLLNSIIKLISLS